MTHAYSKGHLFRICDAIADAHINEILQQDPTSYAHFHVCINPHPPNEVHIFGQVNVNNIVLSEDVSKAIVHAIFLEAGYSLSTALKFTVHVHISSIDFDHALEDHGSCHGYASTQTQLYETIANSFIQQYEQEAHRLPGLMPAAHVHVVSPECIHMSVETDPTISFPLLPEGVQQWIFQWVGKRNPHLRVHVLERPLAMTYTSGQIASRPYTGLHPFHMARAGTIQAQHMANWVIQKGYATRCEISLSYGVDTNGNQILPYRLDTFGTETVPISKWIRELEVTYPTAPVPMILAAYPGKLI